MLCACAFTAHAQGNTSQTTDMKNSKKVLVVFFSRTGENYAVGNIEKGNTHIIAEMIAKETGGKLFRIETVKPYPDEYKACVEVAKAEKENNARPEVKGDVKVEDYNIIFLGYPNWWGDMPQPLFTFLEEYDFSGKTIIPFNSHGGSGFSNTIEEIKELQPDANISDEGLSISRDKVADSVQDVTDWAKSLDLSEK